MRWGPASGGLRANLEVGGRDGYAYHPGESLNCVGVLENTSGRPLQVPRDLSMEYAQLHVRLPDGHHLINSPWYRGDTGAQRPPWPNQLGYLQVGGTDLAYHNDVRLAEGVNDWVEAAAPQIAVLASFRQVGRYEFWMTYAVPAGNADAWAGDLSSDHVIIDVSELPPDERLREPTAQQLAALDQLLGPGDGSIPHQGYATLQPAMLLTENEGLARRIVDVIQRDPATGARLGILVQERYGIWHGPGAGIDGPYLERYASATVDGIERGRPLDVGGMGGGEPQPDWDGVLAYLHFHPGPAPLRDRIVAIARRSSRIGAAASATCSAVSAATAPTTRLVQKPIVSVPTAWQILVESRSLPAGMKLADAIQILGSPTVREAGQVEWRLVGDFRREGPSVTRLVASRDGDRLGQCRLEFR